MLIPSSFSPIQPKCVGKAICVKMDIDRYRFHQYHIEIVEVCAEERYEVIPLQEYSPARNFFLDTRQQVIVNN